MIIDLFSLKLINNCKENLKNFKTIKIFVYYLTNYQVIIFKLIIAKIKILRIFVHIGQLFALKRKKVLVSEFLKVIKLFCASQKYDVFKLKLQYDVLYSLKNSKNT